MALPQKTRGHATTRGGRVIGRRRASSYRKTAKSYQAKIFVASVRLTPGRITDLRSSPMTGARTARRNVGGTRRRVRSRFHG